MLKIVLRGDPVPQGRPRLWMRGGKTHVFDPQSALKSELKREVVSQFENAFISRFKHPRVHFWFSMPIPKSMGRNERGDALKGHLKHIKKPDVDNLIKLYLDVMSGIVFDDDNCVALGSAVKIYSDRPRTEILIEETTPFITLNEVWEGTWPSQTEEVYLEDING